MRVRVVVVAALTLIAGCGGGGPETAGTVPPQLAGTPSVTPTASAASETADGVPGLSESGVDADRLAAVHRDRLRAQSRTVRRVVTIRDTNGTLLGRNTAVIHATDERAETVRVRGTSAGRNPRAVGLSPAWIDFWTNGTAAATKRVVNGSVSYDYRSGPLPPGPQADATGWTLVRFALGLVNETRVERRGDDRVVIRATAERAGSVEDLRLRAVVSRSGIVRELRLAYSQRMDGRRVRVVRRLVVSDLGTTTVSRPTWLPTARDASRTEGAETPTATDATSTTTETDATSETNTTSDEANETSGGGDTDAATGRLGSEAAEESVVARPVAGETAVGALNAASVGAGRDGCGASDETPRGRAWTATERGVRPSD